jgi:hypothetical protein
MDDILRRMLEVERQATQVVANSQTAAQRLLDEGRRVALAEGVRLRAELAAETRQWLADRVARAEAAKAEALGLAEARLQARARAFAAAVCARADRVLHDLAFPMDAAPS